MDYGISMSYLLVYHRPEVGQFSPTFHY